MSHDDDVYQAGYGGGNRLWRNGFRRGARIGRADARPRHRACVGSGDREAGERSLGVRTLPMLVASGSSGRLLRSAPLGLAWARLGLARPWMGPRMGTSGLGAGMGTSGLGRWLARRVAPLVIRCDAVPVA